jgi:phytoene dehydrogenase-like protein
VSGRHDVVVVGAGHNGLVTACYLAKAGLDVVVVEERDIVGGACVTEELMPGFRCSSCAFVANDLTPKVLRDLELGRFGLELYQTGVSVASLGADGSGFVVWNDLGRTLRELDRLGPREAAGFVAFGLRMERLARTVQPLLLQAPPSLSGLASAFEADGDLALFNEFFTFSAKDLLDRYFESDLVKGLFAFFAMVSTWGGPRTPGTAYVYAHHSWGEYEGRMGQFAFPRGGMGAITQALAACARHHGAEIATGARVVRVTASGGRVSGIETEAGRTFSAPVVVSNADPHRTFGQLVAAADLPEAFVADAARIDFRGSMARVHLALDGLPEFLAGGPGSGPFHAGVTVANAGIEPLERAWDAQRYGRVADDLVVEFIVPSTHDPTLAPPGKHLMITGVQQLPFELADGSWDDFKPELVRRVVRSLARVSPGIEDRIVDTATITPLDLERTYGITGGNIFHGALTLGQIFGSRPLPGFTDYRTPLPGLYLCGAGTHPGGGVSGAPGHNAAAAILGDLRGEPRTAVDAARPRRRETLPERLYRRPRARQASLFLARQRWMRPLLGRMATRRRGH